MALKFRRGDSTQKSGSLAFGEPFVNTTLNTLQIGGASGDITLATSGENAAFAGASVSASSFISGSALKITGNAAIDGNLTIGGALTIGDQTTDTFNILATLSSSLIPSVDNSFDIGSRTNRYKNIYAGGSISASVIEVESGSTVEVRLKNTQTGIEYHIQNNNAGNFAIHNNDTGNAIFRIDSGSYPQHAHFFGDLIVTGSIISATRVNAPYMLSSFTGSFSGSVNGIGSVTDYSSSVNTRLVSTLASASAYSGAFATTISNLGTNYATDAELSSFSGAVAVTISNLGSTYATDSELSLVSGAFATTLSNLDSTYATDAQLSSVSGAFATTVANLGNTYATDAELTSVSSAMAVTDSAQDVLIASLRTNVVSASVYTTFSTSVDSRLDSVEAKTGSLATTGSNTFIGTQTITGSLYVTQDLVVGGSSSIQTISSSRLDIGDNIVLLNVASPFQRYGGFAVQDSGSANGLSASVLWDSVNNKFLYVHPTGADTYASAWIMSGPTSATLGSETGLTANKVVKATDDDHIGDSQISDNGTTVGITGALIVTGSGTFGSVTTTGAVSGSTFTGLGNLTTYSTSVASRLVVVEAVSASAAAALSSFSSSNATIETTQNTNITTATQAAAGAFASASVYSSSFATTIGNLGSTYATDAELSAVSGAVATTILNLGSTYATDAELSAVSASQATRDAGIDTTINTLSSSVNTRLVTLEGKDISVTLTGDVTGTGTITDLGNVSFATTIAANSVALGTDTTGNYMSDLTQGTGVTITHTPGEGSNATIAIGQAVSTTSNVTFGNVTATGTVSGSTFTGLGNLTTYSSSVASRLVAVEGKDFTITLTGDVTGTGTVTDLGSVSFATTIAADSVALGTDTTGNYVGTITAGTGVSSTGATTGEGIAHTISIGQAVATSDNVRFNSLGIGMAASATAGRIDASGDIVAYSTSDKNFKENITPIPNALDKISKISGNTYDWKADMKEFHGFEGNDVGVIAQEIEAVLPQLVTTRETGYKAVKYDKLVALLIEGIKEQQQQIHSLTIEVENLKKQNGL